MMKRKTNLKNIFIEFMSIIGKSQQSDHRRPIEEMIKIMDQRSKVKGKSVLHAMDNVDYYAKLIINVCKNLSAMPSSQVTVEQLFSAVMFVLSGRRRFMKDKLLNAIPFLKTNPEMMKQISNK